MPAYEKRQEKVRDVFLEKKRYSSKKRDLQSHARSDPAIIRDEKDRGRKRRGSPKHQKKFKGWRPLVS